MINKNQECDIISDLLPLYLEHKTSEETGEFIREHLQECESCRKSLWYMDTSYEELFAESKEKAMQKKESKKSTKKMLFGKAKGKLFVYGYLLFLMCVWIYIIACYI